MKYLVMGSRGMAGHMVSIYLAEQGHDVTGFARSNSNFIGIKTVIGDAFDLDFVKSVVSDGRYDAIVNCIGVLNEDADNHHAKAVFLNSFFPHFLAEITSKQITKVIQISTDCVFSGERGQYTEEDFPDGKTFYDRSKALGELNDSKNLTLRMSIIGPDMNSKGIGLMNWFLQQRERVKGFTNVFWSGQTTLQLAKTIDAGMLSNASGLFNMVPHKAISKFDLLELMNRYLRVDKIVIERDGRQKVDKSLKRTKFDFDYIIPEYSQMIEELSVWISSHASLYPHYQN